MLTFSPVGLYAALLFAHENFRLQREESLKLQKLMAAEINGFTETKKLVISLY